MQTKMYNKEFSLKMPTLCFSEEVADYLENNAFRKMKLNKNVEFVADFICEFTGMYPEIWYSEDIVEFVIYPSHTDEEKDVWRLHLGSSYSEGELKNIVSGRRSVLRKY